MHAARHEFTGYWPVLFALNLHNMSTYHCHQLSRLASCFSPELLRSQAATRLATFGATSTQIRSLPITPDARNWCTAARRPELFGSLIDFSPTPVSQRNRPFHGFRPPFCWVGKEIKERLPSPIQILLKSARGAESTR